MPENTQGVEQNSPSALGEALASSPEVKEAAVEQSLGTQTPPAQEGVSQGQETQQAEEEARVPYSRLKEVVDEKNYFKSLWEQDRQKQLSQQQFPQPTPQQDPYAGLSPEERLWRQEEDKRIEQRVRQIVNTEYAPLYEAALQRLTDVTLTQFRTQHPDIKPHSPEENEIAELVSQGYKLEHAYRITMFDRGRQVAEQQVKQQTKQKIEAKKQANVEQSSVPVTSGLPQKTKLTQRQLIERNLNDIEAGKI